MSVIYAIYNNLKLIRKHEEAIRESTRKIEGCVESLKQISKDPVSNELLDEILSEWRKP